MYKRQYPQTSLPFSTESRDALRAATRFLDAVKLLLSPSLRDGKYQTPSPVLPHAWHQPQSQHQLRRFSLSEILNRAPRSFDLPASQFCQLLESLSAAHAHVAAQKKRTAKSYIELEKAREATSGREGKGKEGGLVSWGWADVVGPKTAAVEGQAGEWSVGVGVRERGAYELRWRVGRASWCARCRRMRRRSTCPDGRSLFHEDLEPTGREGSTRCASSSQRVSTNARQGTAETTNELQHFP
jgi:hypothetical protein